MKATLHEYLVDLKESNRVCPMPKPWNEMYEMLKGKRRVGFGWEPSLPLILAAWYDTPLISKHLRFREHLEWAEKQVQLEDIIEYLDTLKEEDWLHETQ